ncbi:MAG TPA: transglutaminase family protein, partial [Polyangia bacterium]|nr:transglutaminase family protein [Polyangia bacterium]
DVRLTMGGEPTFVSVDDMESAEWSTAATGPHKEERADALARRLWARFAEGGALHHGLGKWYPGEPLPRWAYSIYWRKDGEPVWRDPALIAGSQARNDGAEQARLFVRTLVAKLGIEDGYVMPAYEDVWYWLWKERRLPVNVDPLDYKLEDEDERVRLRRIFGQGLGNVVGWTVPLRVEQAPTGMQWQSGAWLLRDERLYLMPGDSPMGLRLPLDSLPWTTPEDLLADAERDPFAPRPLLPPRRALEQSRPGNIRRGVPMQRGVAARPIVRTALCVEPRNGRLHVFLPPVGYLEHYLDLIAKVEACAAELRLPVRLEGYTPPNDPRLHKLSVTPDPGVIEVNVQPASSWRQLVDNTTALYEEARQVRLGTDKFMIDGRHTGTGGGNHVVIGGERAADSPLLRKPELLRSLIAYFINHPSLSYLFSGQFVGPTSQAPRLDEARQDSLYELEAAFRALSASQQPPPPWLVDRLFRHLLVDVTGNGHRTELCLDKLFSPDSATGRLGLLEMRGFEMPPDARMSCAQQLLVRALVASFWKTPYEQPLVRWGTQLHDRFMLPHFVWQDLADVTAELGRRDLIVDAEWFRPHWEFRFPRHGAVALEGVDLEIRQAIEPWHVLGEEPGGGGTVRYVDSSVERVQVLARGLVPGRHVVACNGRRVPLHPTGRAGEGVAGVRYKAWKPPSSLHPTLDVDAPLTFDLVDTWSGRAVGGCTYYVSHPAGRHYDTYPRNGLEAEARRATRF